MKSIKRLLLLVLICYFPLASLTAQQNETFFLHTIEKGQNLYSISSMYGVSQADIIRLNPGCEEKIYAGRTLKIPQTKDTTKKEDIFHTIQSGETLYRLTQLYNVSARDIVSENPGLSAENFKIGQVVRIPTKGTQFQAVKEAEKPKDEFVPIIQPEVKPKCRDMHKVKRKETVFSVSRQYGLTEQELINANPELKKGMKKGQYLCIPYSKGTATTPVQEKQEERRDVTPPSNRELFAEVKERTQQLSPIKAAIVLPFAQSSTRTRMVEYYEGFLLAMDSLKRQNVSIDLYVYDSGTENTSIAPILSKPEMKKMDIIFGPLHQQHIKPLTNFADENNIRLVIPFTSRDNEVFQNPNIYQINTPQSYLYSEVYERFTKQFPNAHVVFLEGLAEQTDKEEFIKGFETDLGVKGISFTKLNGNLSLESLKEVILPGKQNIFVPTTGSDLALIKAIPQLVLLVRDSPDYEIHLFGYPEWQTYTKDHLESFFELDTYFYSSFYTNNLLPSAVGFIHKYHKWYSKEMANIYPKYGMLGFDTGYFFLSGLARYGSEFENNLPKIDLASIQTGFKFERVNNWGGFINKKVFFVHFTKSFEVVKLEF